MSLRIRKEPAFFLAFTALLAWSVSSMLSDGARSLRERRGGGGQMEYAPRPVPEVDLALCAAGRDGDFSRDLFTPPRDTAPLPPLELELPPLEPLDALAPPTAYGPSARHMGALLRRALTVIDVPGLFGLESPEEGPGAPGGGSTDVVDLPESELSPAERLARIEARKKLYDWIVVADLKFGHIRNKDRFDLARSLEPIQFVEVRPATGEPLYPGQGPIPYERDRVSDFGLADTPANRIGLRRRDFGDPLGPGDLEAALRFAGECLALRNDAPRGLEVAEQMYQLCAEVTGAGVRAGLGLARCYELGFRFEEAFAIYRELTGGEAHTEPAPWARLGDLYARFRMPARAESCYREALGRVRTSWEARWRYGRFLLDQGRGAEALQHLREAQRREPNAPELRAARVAIRADLGRAHLGLGQVREALEAFERARDADPSRDTGLAGMISASLLLAGSGSLNGNGDLSEERPDASFDLLLARGLRDIERQQWPSARRALEQAAEADPFRAWQALRALSWLAEITGHPEEAFVFVQRAYEQNPLDPWTLYQRGRLLAQQDDLLGAMTSFRAALDRELDFSDALAAMGALSRAGGELEAAERYFERALSIDPRRPVVHSLRGFNAFAMGDVPGALRSFQAALDLRPDLASALNGLAWWYYVSGDSEQAKASFGKLQDSRRNLPDDDPAKVYAKTQAERITEHEAKEVWSDRFDRVGRLGNGWSYDQEYGPEVRLREGQVWLEGQFDAVGRTRLIRRLPADRFLSFEATVTVHPESQDVIVGLYVSRETDTRQGQARVTASVELRRNRDGVVQAKLTRRGESDARPQDLFSTAWPLGKPMRVRIEKVGEKASDTAVTLWVDDVAVLENVPIQTLGRSTQELRFGIFVDGPGIGRRAAVSVDDVSVVRRIR